MSKRCERCGARVEDEIAHHRFHVQVDEQATKQRALQDVLFQLVGTVGRLNDLTHDMRRACNE